MVNVLVFVCRSPIHRDVMRTELVEMKGKNSYRN